MKLRRRLLALLAEHKNEQLNGQQIRELFFRKYGYDISLAVVANVLSHLRGRIGHNYSRITGSGVVLEIKKVHLSPSSQPIRFYFLKTFDRASRRSV